MLLKHNFNILGRTVNFLLRVAPEKTSFHYGIGNRTKDGQYLVFLDYDDTPLEWIQEEIRLLQRNTDLGTAYMFKTKNGHHVMFLEKFLLDELLFILGMTSIDKRYMKVPMMYGRKIWVLRQTDKKQEKVTYLGCLRNWDYFETNIEEQPERSRAHGLYLTKYCNVPMKDVNFGGYMDDHDDLIVGCYHIAE